MRWLVNYCINAKISFLVEHGAGGGVAQVT
jgi:hypothetical protein